MNFYYLSKEYGHTDACDAAFWSLDIAIEPCVIPNGFDGAGVALARTDRRFVEVRLVVANRSALSRIS